MEKALSSLSKDFGLLKIDQHVLLILHPLQIGIKSVQFLHQKHLQAIRIFKSPFEVLRHKNYFVQSHK